MHLYPSLKVLCGFVWGLVFIALQQHVAGQTRPFTNSTNYVNFPLYIEDDDMESTLVINNNTRAGRTDTIRVTVFNHKGEALDPIAVPVSYFTPVRLAIKGCIEEFT